MPALRRLRPRLHSGHKAKAMRVAAISTDQLVPCPTCGGFMRLSDAQAFECKQCGRAIRVEGVLKSIDGGD
jgi:tRNA(Ile2) C34 agmatinyltransferase TiaS